MTKKKLAEFKKLLTSRLQELLAEADRTAQGMSTRENCADPADVATNDNDQARMLRIRDREAKLIVKIQEAIEKIAGGSYGVCEACGDEISEQRLMARPMAVYCIECKMEMESDEARDRFGALKQPNVD